VTLPLRRFIFAHCLILILLFTGCKGGIPGFSPTETWTPSPTETLTPTATLTPTPTPLPPVGVLLAPPEADSQLVAKMQPLLSGWISEIGYRFQIRPSLNQQDFERDDFRLVVAVPPNPEIASMIAGHPEIRFLTLGIQGLEPAPNLSSIGADGERLDHQGFIAGYMAALITPDWRVGVISLSGDPETTKARQAFYTGVKFYCGLCSPSYPPFIEYPLYFELGSDADTTEWRAAASFLIQRSVETVYVVPGAGDDEMLRYLAQSGVNIIGGKAPLPDIQDHWVASLQFDPFQAFLDFWPAFIANPDNQAITVPLGITDVNSDLLSMGRQRLVEETLTDVLAGYVDLGLEDVLQP
jgi:hypothetical protein